MVTKRDGHGLADHPGTTSGRGSLTIAYLEAGHAAGSITVNEQTLPACEQLSVATTSRSS